MKSIRILSLQYGIAVSLCLLYVNLNASAQTFTGHAGIGATPVVGQLSNELNTGWHASAGGGIKFGSEFETTLDYNYHDFGVSRFVFNQIPLPNVNSHMWSVTVNPKVQIPTSSRFSPCAIGGVGLLPADC